MRRVMQRADRQSYCRPVMEMMEERRLLDGASISPLPVPVDQLGQLLQFASNEKITLSDTDGDQLEIRVKFRDSNETGQVGIAPGGSIEFITLNGDAVNVKLKAKQGENGDGVINVGQLYGEEVAKLVAKGIRFVGGQEFSFDGGVRVSEAGKIQFGGLENNAGMWVLGSTAEAGVLIKLDDVDTTSEIDAQDFVKLLGIKGNATLGTLNINDGAKSIKVGGNLTATTTVDVNPNSDNADAKTKIDIRGNVDVANMQVDQNVTRARIGGDVLFGSNIIFGALMTNMLIAGSMLGTLTMLQALRTGKIGGDVDGTLSLYQAQKVTIAGALFGSLLATYESVGSGDLAIKALTLGAMQSGIFHTWGHVAKMIVIGAFINSQILFGVSPTWSLANDGFPAMGASDVLGLGKATLIGSLILRGRGVDYAFFSSFIIGYGITKLQMGRLGAFMGGGIAMAETGVGQLKVKEVGFQGPRFNGNGADDLLNLATGSGLDVALLGNSGGAMEG